MKIAAAIIPILLGGGLLVYGAVFHARTVYFDEEVEIEAPPIEQDPFAPIVDESWLPPPETTLVENTVVEPEHRLVLEVSRGGVLRGLSGKIRRTYLGDVAPPDLCPT